MSKVFKNVVIKNKVLIGLILVASALLFFYTKENFEDCENSSTGNDMPALAKDACNKISSRADEIQAELGGAGNIVANIFPFLNPQNYAAGDNTTNSLTRNIINTNLSQCEITKIDSSCNQSSTTSQSNILRAGSEACIPVCLKFGCDNIGNNQSNTAKTSQVCSLQTAIQILTEKTNSVDAQALAKVLQKTEGILSGSNKTQTENCNLIANDLSSKKYFEDRKSCLNNASTTQLNEAVACGSNINNIQENDSIIIQECMIGAKIESKSTVDNDTKVSTKLDVDQLSKGLDLNVLGAISGVSSLSSSSCFLLLVVIVLGWVSSNKEDIKEIIRNN